MKPALCNEVIAAFDWPRQCAFSAALGFRGLEVAPYTLGAEPHLIGAGEAARLKRTAADAGIAVAGLHWLLIAPKGLSITDADPAIRDRTRDVMRRLIDLCAELGGQYLVHGSPHQRRLPEGADRAAARERAIETLALAARAAEAAGVTYCLEALAPPDANFVNRIAEAAEIVRRIGSPGLRTMIDCSAAGLTEGEPLEAVADRWLPTGLIAHVQVNDRNRRGPGQGGDRFLPLFQALKRWNYDGWIAAEPFDYVPDGPAAAAHAAGYVKALMESLS
ncbi:MAG: sugar phosphate isomerase/epimerase [Alphaproteobacteria bacterium]|nr:sugar phosphate isomerase/epimerase [Alphaproteobacteria bacterium]